MTVIKYAPPLKPKRNKIKNKKEKRRSHRVLNALISKSFGGY